MNSQFRSIYVRFVAVAAGALVLGALVGANLDGASRIACLVLGVLASAGVVIWLASPLAKILSKTFEACQELSTKDSKAVIDLEVSSGFRPLMEMLVQVRERIHWYTAMLDSIPFPVSVTDNKMNWTFINRPVEQFLKVKREDIIGKQCNNWSANICRTENCGIERLRCGKTNTLFDQQGLNFQVDTAYILDSHGNRTGHIEVVQDISDKVKAFQYQKHQIENLAAVLKKIAEQDLTVTSEVDAGDQHTREVRESFLALSDNLNNAVRNLHGTMLQVHTAAEKVTAASSQINEGSQALSHHATGQAASLEETASSLQEMASMATQNASNARQAKALVDSATIATEKGSRVMQVLNTAISKIKQSADATAKIVKTIDEIAFQTNLLALNAAVEAARAGDAGRGFAVVAEEVRNLAIRSAEAAKNTAVMIEEAIQNADSGMTTNQKMISELNEITVQVKKVSEVMADITEASRQQNEGVLQINKTVEQMNQSIQQMASSSEESASAAVELTSQAMDLRNMVGSFRLERGSKRIVPNSEFNPIAQSPFGQDSFFDDVRG